MYSFSQLSLRGQCPRKYQYRYIDKLKPSKKELTADLLLGTVVHKTLEKLYQSIIQGSIRDKKRSIDFLERYRNTKIEESQGKWFPVVTKWNNKTIASYLERWKTYISQYYDKHSPFTDIKIFDIELRLDFYIGDWTSENKKLVGYIDRLDKSNNTYTIIDYKTNTKLPNPTQNPHQDQLILYAHWVQQKYWKPTDKFIIQLEYLHFQTQQQWEITDIEINKINTKYSQFIDQIENSRFLLNMWDETAFPICENSFCKYCEYIDICPLQKFNKN